MSAHFDVYLSSEPAALQRLLGVVRRRGFTVTALSALHDEQRHAYHVDLCVDGARCPTVLQNHIANLADVRTVNVLGPLPRTTCA